MATTACTFAAASSHTDSRGCFTTSRSLPLTRISRPPLCQDSSQQGLGQCAAHVSPDPLPPRQDAHVAQSLPPEADAGLCRHELGVGRIAERNGQQRALGMAKDHTNHSFSWPSLGHGVAHNGLRTHWLLAAGERSLVPWALASAWPHYENPALRPSRAEPMRGGLSGHLSWTFMEALGSPESTASAVHKGTPKPIGGTPSREQPGWDQEERDTHIGQDWLPTNALMLPPVWRCCPWMVSWVPPAWGPHWGLRLSRTGSWGTGQVKAGMAAQPGSFSPWLQPPRPLANFSALSPGPQPTTPTFWKPCAWLL